ncbi:MAG: TonB-dependent receptor domain-containing protein [Leptonema sp. (in: bacteria)]
MIKKFILLFLLFSISLYSQNATITGRIIDATTGQPMLGVAVVIREINAFTQSDFDGKYTLSVPPGTYTVLFQMIGYDTKTQTVTVNPGQNLSLNIVMGVQVLAKVVVEERSLNDTEASLLSLQKKSSTVSDGISQEAIKRSPDSSASDVIKRVTGISIIGGKYVFVRGLGERYSSTMLNGSLLPSTEPDKKVVPLDLFPASLLKNIRVIKSFVPEDPGEFSGGLVKIETQEYPDEFTMSLSYGLEYNSITTKKEFKKIKTEGPYDFLGIGPNSKTGLKADVWKLPGIAGTLPDQIPLISGGILPISDQQLGFLFASFNNDWAPKTIQAPYNQTLSFSIGDTVLNKKLGYFYGLYYKKDYEKYNQEEFRWSSGNLSTSWYPELNYIGGYNQIRNANYYQEKVLWGNNINLAYKISNLDQISIKTFLSTNSDKTFRNSISQVTSPDFFDFITETSGYVAREIFSTTMSGDHGIQYTTDMKPHKLHWHYTLSRAVRDEPDRKERLWLRTGFSSDPFLAGQGDGFRYYSSSIEDSNHINVNYELEYPQWLGLYAKLKFGIDQLERNKEFRSKRYKYQNISGSTQFEYYPIPGDLTLNPSRIVSGEYIVFQSSAQLFDSYDAELKVNSRFVQTDLPIIPDLRLIAGIRQEDTYQKTWTRRSTSTNFKDYIGTQCTPEGLEYLRTYLIDSGICPKDDNGVGDYKVTDNLPSVNIVYEFIKDQNIRFAYYESIVRPDPRELSEFAFTPFFAGETIQGNSTLKRSKLKNYDIRWEWYISPEEYIGVSYFIKNIVDPIEIVGQPTTGSASRVYTFINSEKGYLKGFELDFRKDFLKKFRGEFNLYSIKSEVEVMSPVTRELIAQKAFGPNDKRSSLAPTNLKRPLQGQSDFVYNIKLLYFFEETKKLGYIGIYYNYFSDRIVFVGAVGEPDIYEKGKGFWDFVASYNPNERLTLKASIKNLRNQSFETYQESAVGKFKLPYERYKKGIDYSISASYKFN